MNDLSDVSHALRGAPVERPQLAEAIYTAAINNPSGVPRLTYRCASHRCLLLDVIPLPDGDAVLHQGRYKYSATENEARSSEAGRLANTHDGDRHWRGHTYLLTESALNYPEDIPVMGLEVTCDHVLAYRLTAPEFHADLAARHAEVRVRTDGSRFTR